jgi:hypothetical protein
MKIQLKIDGNIEGNERLADHVTAVDEAHTAARAEARSDAEGLKRRALERWEDEGGASSSLNSRSTTGGRLEQGA